MRNPTVKILYVNGGLMDRGGVSSVMMSYFQNIDKNNVHIDFLVHGYGSGVRDDEIVLMGSQIFCVPPKSKNPLKNRKMIMSVLKNGNYDIVHSHADSGNAYILKLAKQCGVKIRISHSHNTNYTINNKLRIVINELQKKLINRYATQKWACSQKAAEWLYGTNCGTDIIHNAIDTRRFIYSIDYRNEIRSRYGLGERYVIGMVGRLDYQKNHMFMVDVMNHLKNIDRRVCLLIVGAGPLEKDVKDIVSKLELDENVVFCGQVKDVHKYYSAMDAFAMPSNFEGLPLAAIEAQCSGLKCYISNRVTEEVKILDSVEYLDISCPECWASAINNNIHDVIRTQGAEQLVANAGYDIYTESRKLESRYLQLKNQ